MIILHGYGDQRIPEFILRDGKAVFNSKDTTLGIFPLGKIVATPAALDAIHDSGQDPFYFLDRHSHGDWGEVSKDDAALNDQALANGDRLLSAYRTLKGVRLLVITADTDDDGEPQGTTLLLESEY
jgi:hypothetical protein